MAESDQKINYEAEYYKEQERIAKLWDAYEEQVVIISDLEKKERDLKKELDERNATSENLEELLSTRDEKIRELEKDLAILQKRDAKFKPTINELESQLDEEKEKVVKIFEVSQELQDELNLAKDALKARDAWFVDNIKVLEKMAEVLEERKNILQGDFKKYLELAEKGMLQTKEEGKEEAAPEKEEEKKELEREEAVKEFSKIEGISEELAGTIWDELVKDMDSLLNIKKYELLKIEEVTASKAEEIMSGIKNYKISEYIIVKRS